MSNCWLALDGPVAGSTRRGWLRRGPSEAVSTLRSHFARATGRSDSQPRPRSQRLTQQPRAGVITHPVSTHPASLMGFRTGSAIRWRSRLARDLPALAFGSDVAEPHAAAASLSARPRRSLSE